MVPNLGCCGGDFRVPLAKFLALKITQKPVPGGHQHYSSWWNSHTALSTLMHLTYELMPLKGEDCRYCDWYWPPSTIFQPWDMFRATWHRCLEPPPGSGVSGFSEVASPVVSIQRMRTPQRLKETITYERFWLLTAVRPRVEQINIIYVIYHPSDYSVYRQNQPLVHQGCHQKLLGVVRSRLFMIRCKKWCSSTVWAGYRSGINPESHTLSHLWWVRDG
jgi:hypothetical protein